MRIELIGDLMEKVGGGGYASTSATWYDIASKNTSMQKYLSDILEEFGDNRYFENGKEYSGEKRVRVKVVVEVDQDFLSEQTELAKVCIPIDEW